MDKQPILHHFSVPLKLLVLGIIIFSSIILVMITGIVIAAPFVGGDIMQQLTSVGTSFDPETIALSKYIQILSQLGIFIIPVLFFAFLENRKIGSYLSLNSYTNFKTFIVASFAIIISTPIINYLGEINQQMDLPASLHHIEQWMKESEENANKLTIAFLNVETIGGFLINLLMIAIIPAIGEEFLFRGVLQKLFIQWTKNVHLGVFIAAFIFSAIHLQFYGFIPRFLMGVYLGYAFVWTGSLWVPITIHFVNNATAVIVTFFSSHAFGENTIDTIGTGNSSKYVVILSILFSSFFIYLLYKFANKHKSIT